MDEDLQNELDRLTRELEVAEADAVRLEARIRGLRAERDSLAAALITRRADWQEQPSEAPLRLETIKKRTEAIEALLRHEGKAMSIDDIRLALNDGWREESSYQVVASTLNMLHHSGRVTKVARGRYAAA